jgi:hypothetical protein
MNYGFKTEANGLSGKTLSLLSSDLDANNSLNEYYDPDSGLALSHKGFVDWNMLMLEMILRRLFFYGMSCHETDQQPRRSQKGQSWTHTRFLYV